MQHETIRTRPASDTQGLGSTHIIQKDSPKPNEDAIAHADTLPANAANDWHETSQLLPIVQNTPSPLPTFSFRSSDIERAVLALTSIPTVETIPIPQSSEKQDVIPDQAIPNPGHNADDNTPPPMPATRKVPQKEIAQIAASSANAPSSNANTALPPTNPPQVDAPYSDMQTLIRLSPSAQVFEPKTLALPGEILPMPCQSDARSGADTNVSATKVREHPNSALPNNTGISGCHTFVLDQHILALPQDPDDAGSNKCVHVQQRTAPQNDSRGLDMGYIIAHRYEIIDEIARGGFGIVYRARQIGVDRIIALKRLHSQEDPSVVERFLREATIIKDLIHPNTIQLIDAGTDNDNHLYIVMEYIEGHCLRELLESNNGLALPRAVHITAQILKSVNEAHQRGIIHRDLKPNNILIRKVIGENDFIKVLDFGIAKAMHCNDERLTVIGTILGTPQYMAPELFLGHPAGPYVDVYAIALMLGHMVTGSPLVPSSTVEAFKMHASPDPIPLPAWLEQSPLGPILQKGLEKDYRKRYQNAQEMLADIKKLQKAIAAQPNFYTLKSESTSANEKHKTRRTRILKILIIALLILINLVLIYFLF
ncbi:MAG: serine/threonine protein kinase [Proteobacteria bacterium]|nr:serine/threonine protein kinase [Pseudomonadota bacterium]